MKGSEGMWRKANDEERAVIRKSFMPREIASAIMVAIMDFVIIYVMLLMVPKSFNGFSVGSVIVAIPISLFFIYVLYYTFRAIYKSVKIAYLIISNKYSVAECKLDEVKVNRIGLVNNANIVASTSDGETYRTSYGSAFTTKAIKGQSGLLMSLGKEIEILLR